MVTVEEILAEYGDTPRMEAYIRTAALLLDIREKIHSSSEIVFEVNAFIHHVNKVESGYYDNDNKIETLEELYERLKNFPDKPKGDPSLTFDCYMRKETKEMRQENFQDF
ncbi:MAG: hypothetical protein ACT4OY_01310 [Alphaproteobacteria bacterium]